MKTQGSKQGFSLVEIMLALAIMAVGLIAIIGLIPRGVQASREAADNTISSTIVHDIIGTIRTKPFTAVDLTTGYGFSAVFSLQNAVSVFAYFDQAGFANPLAQDRYYKVTLTVQPVDAFTLAPLALNASLSQVTATIVWPANSAAPANTSVFVTQIANYQQ